MAWLPTGYDVMPKNDDDSVSPYLRKPLRPYEEVQREPADETSRVEKNNR